MRVFLGSEEAFREEFRESIVVMLEDVTEYRNCRQIRCLRADLGAEPRINPALKSEWRRLETWGLLLYFISPHATGFLESGHI